jgi:GTP cyclohydrolase II
LSHSTSKPLRNDLPGKGPSQGPLDPSRAGAGGPGPSSLGRLARGELPTSYATRALLQDLAEVRARVRPRGRAFVTLAYAQSLDGSITTARGQRYALSGSEAMRFTHTLRATHDAILVGVGTVLADDPQLRVRLVEGPDPQPVVVDSNLRTPAAAKLLSRTGRPVWIATAAPTDGGDGSAGEVRRSRVAHVEARGGRIVGCPALPNGWVDLAALLRQLAADGIEHVMVEGGARIITSLIEAQLADYLMVTVVPQLLGGLSAVAPLARPVGLGAMARVERWVNARLGDDLVLGGEMTWPAP